MTKIVTGGQRVNLQILLGTLYSVLLLACYISAACCEFASVRFIFKFVIPYVICILES